MTSSVSVNKHVRWLEEDVLTKCNFGQADRPREAALPILCSMDTSSHHNVSLVGGLTERELHEHENRVTEIMCVQTCT